MKPVATNHAGEMKPSPESSWMSFLMRHQSTIPEITMTHALCPDIAILNAQTVTCFKDAPYHTLGVVSPNNNPLTLWDAYQTNSLDASVHSVTTSDLETLYDQVLWDTPWANISNNEGAGPASDTIGSSQETNDSTYAHPSTPKTIPPQLFQCHRQSIGKRSEETICGRCFPDKRGLTRHERNVHTSDGYKCRCSTRLITRKDNHRRHVKSCDRIADPNQPIYICRCGTPDSDKDGHLRHLKTCTIRSGGAERQSDIGDGA